MSKKPFVVEVPKGATEIDLGPVIRPLLWALKAKLDIHEGRPHTWSGHKKLDHHEPDEVDDIMEWVVNAFKYNQLILTLKRKVLVAYLEGNGYVDEDGRGYTYIRDCDLKKPSWDRYHPPLHLHSPSEPFKLHVAKDVVGRLAHEGKKTKLEQLEEILGYDNILDRIAREI